MSFFRALLAFLLLPGIVALLVPPIFAALDPWKADREWIGVPVILLGATILILCVRDFYVSGKGTLAPWDPPRRLVVVGLYRFVRNPMYIGVIVLVFGWSLLFASLLLSLYTVIIAVGFHLRVLLHEEPWLRRQFGDDWSEYHENVRRWLPRTRPWCRL